MRVIGDKNQIFEDVFDFMISYLPFPQYLLNLLNFFPSALKCCLFPQTKQDKFYIKSEVMLTLHQKV